MRHIRTAKLSEESKLSITAMSTGIKLSFEWVSLSSERDISVRKTICHDVVEYQFQRERTYELPTKVEDVAPPPTTTMGDASVVIAVTAMQQYR